MCIVNNSARMVVSATYYFLLWSRIIQIIDALVLRVMELRSTQEKALMECITFTRDRKSASVSENSAKLRFAYHFSIDTNSSDVSRTSGVIGF